MSNYFEMNVDQIQPSQLYISKKKLTEIQKQFDSKKPGSLGVIPIKKLDDEIIFTDGHTRAFTAYLADFKSIKVEWETEELDWEMYQICVQWCKDESILTIADLKSRVIDHNEYEILWYKKCKDMQQKIIENRKKIASINGK
jgi:hypothetical protein